MVFIFVCCRLAPFVHDQSVPYQCRKPKWRFRHSGQEAPQRSSVQPRHYCQLHCVSRGLAESGGSSGCTAREAKSRCALRFSRMASAPALNASGRPKPRASPRIGIGRDPLAPADNRIACLKHIVWVVMLVIRFEDLLAHAEISSRNRSRHPLVHEPRCSSVP